MPPFSRKSKDPKSKKKSDPAAPAKKKFSLKNIFSSLKKKSASKKVSPSAGIEKTAVRKTNVSTILNETVARANPEEKKISHRLEIPTVQVQPPPPPQELPWNYGDNQIYAIVRDPYYVYTYWEIQPDHQQRALDQLGGSWDSVKSILRIYDDSESNGKKAFFDIALQGLATTWYINVQPNRSFYIEIGLLHQDGRFVALARSNRVTTPRDGMSEVIDEQWMGIDFDKIYALSGGFEMGKSSMELKKLMEQRLQGAISSGSGAGHLSSMSSPSKMKKRGFWFVLDCELIVYGATEPDATVISQGKEVKLRPDGTFTMRFALPDGKQVIDCHAHSADGVEERVITPTVTRATERPAPIFKKSF